MNFPKNMLERNDVPIEVKKEITKCIEEYNQTKKALQESKDKYKLLFETIGDAIFIHNTKGQILATNQKACELLGYTKIKLLTMKVTDIDAPAENKNSQDRIVQLIKNGHLEFETNHQHKNGSLIPIEVNARMINWEKQLAIISVCRDITNRRMMVGKLEESKEKYRMIAENTSDVIWTTDLNFNLTYVNKAIFNFLGYSPDEFIGLNPAVFTTQKGVQTIKTNAEKLLEIFGNKKITQKVFEVHQIKKDGTLIDVEITANLLIDKKGAFIGFQGRSIDITEQKKRERNEQLESLGSLAGGIIHDFNNILTKTLGFLSLLRDENNPKIRKDLIEKAEQATIQGSNISRELLIFVKGRIPELVIDSISKIAKEAVILCVGKGYPITYEFDLSRNSYLTEIDANKIHRIFQNLTINAIQAMPNGGKISITAEDLELMPNELDLLDGGKYVKIIFSDNGPGISKKVLSRIFEPYFTTKSDGTGLGLAKIYSIIRDHKGFITVDSTQGEGTTFNIYIPATKKIPAKVTLIKNSDNTHKKSLKILVMDDEKYIREITEGLLGKFGHQVISTADGEKALMEYSSALTAKCPFDLVFLDLTIPGGMGGKETLKNLQKIDPSVIAIISSGYSDDLPNGFVAGLGKPYTIDKLEQVLTSVIKRFNL